MSEKLPELKNTPELQALVRHLTLAAYTMDADFRHGYSHATEHIKSSKYLRGLIDPGDETVQPIYDQQSIYFSAERDFTIEPSKKITQPKSFTVRYDMETQIEELPPALRNYLKPDDIELYDSVEFGDLNTLQTVEYKIDNDDMIDISRNISYMLRDGDQDIIYSTSETDETGKFEFVHLAHEQQTLVVNKVIHEEKIHDEIDQIPFYIKFDDMFSSMESSSFYNELVQARDTEASICILALIKSLKKGSPIPDILYNTP